MQYFIQTFGCQMNENDSENIAGQLRDLGYTACADITIADCIVINTCCVRESAEKKIYGKIGELKRYKNANPRLITIVTGCMAQKDSDKILEKYPYVDIVIGPQCLEHLNDALVAATHGERLNYTRQDITRFNKSGIQPERQNSVSAYVSIMHGCNNFCSYCIVPYVRGREVSRASEDVIDEIRDISSSGIKEITLLGQNVNSYNGDNGTTSFSELLKLADKISGIERIRYMTSHPRDMNEDIIKTIASSRAITNHFHLPVQAGDDFILQKMNRGYTTAYYLNLLQQVRYYVPNATITTDIIVGFPGETNDMFENTLKLLQNARFDQAYTFMYSRRSGTPASTMPDQVALAVKKERLHKLMQLQNEISLQKNRECVGETYDVMVEGPSRKNDCVWSGRTAGNKIVLWDKRGNEMPGEMLKIKITNAKTWLLYGMPAD